MIQPLTEQRITVDADARRITVPKQLASIGVCGDTNAETVFIYCPRYFDNIDWYDKTCLIRYINAGGEYGEYPVTNIAIDPSDNKMLIIGWTIKSPVTSYTGSVNFTLQFETELSGNLLYQWQTQPASIRILAGIDGLVGSNGVVSTDTYAALSARVDAIENLLSTLNIANSMAIINGFQSTLNNLVNRTQYLENNVVYLSVPSNQTPADISYSVVVVDGSGNNIESFVLYYGKTHQIIITDATGNVVTGLNYSSDSPYVSVDNNGNVSVNYVYNMPEIVTATITTDYNAPSPSSSSGYSVAINNSDGTPITSLNLGVGTTYQITIKDSSGNIVPASNLIFSSDNPNVTVDTNGLVTVNYTNGMSMTTTANITVSEKTS